MDKVHPLAIPSFLADGGTRTLTFDDFILTRETGPVDYDAFVEFVGEESPITQEVEGRITICYEELDETCEVDGGDGGGGGGGEPEDDGAASARALPHLLALMLISALMSRCHAL